jgi:hypothetical protein
VTVTPAQADEAPESDQDLWAGVTAAEQHVARARARFHQYAQDQVPTLRAALRSRNRWDTKAALTYLAEFGQYVPELLDDLVELAMSIGWALYARRAIAHGPSDAVAAGLERIMRAKLVGQPDPDDVRRLAETLDQAGPAYALAELVEWARASENEEIREVAADFS